MHPYSRGSATLVRKPARSWRWPRSSPLRIARRHCWPSRDVDGSAHGPPGSRGAGLPPGDGLGHRLRLFRPLHPAVHPGELCDRGGLRGPLEAVDVMFAPRPPTVTARAEPPAVGTKVWFDHGDAVLAGVDAHHLVELARRHDCALELRIPVGTFLTRGAELMEVHGGTPPEAGAILGTLNCSAVRTLYQDPCYGVRQLVDIAIRALSPAVNDPTTAVQTLDRLHGIMRSIANRPDPSGLRGWVRLVRLIVPVPGMGTRLRSRLHRSRSRSRVPSRSRGSSWRRSMTSPRPYRQTATRSSAPNAPGCATKCLRAAA